MQEFSSAFRGTAASLSDAGDSEDQLCLQLASDVCFLLNSGCNELLRTVRNRTERFDRTSSRVRH